MTEKTRLEYKKFAACIEVDGKELTCYAMDTNKKENHISCWIASEEGKNFAIKLSKDETKANCRVSVQVDGKRVGQSHCKRKKSRFRYDALQTSSTTERLFMFAPLQTTDDDNYADLASHLSKTAKELGEISLKIHRVTRLTTVQCARKKTSDIESELVPKPLKVHESSRKAATMPHQIAFEPSFGEQRKRGQKNTSGMHTTTSCDVHELLATFVFRYRPLDVLRACGIVHSQPTLPSMEVPRGESSLTEGPTTGMPQAEVQEAEVQAGQEDPDDIYFPEALHPLENSTVSSSITSPLDLENLVEVKPKQEEGKPDVSEDDDDEVTKTLMAEVERRRNEKRKAKEAAAGQRKRIKREVLTFFKPGEVPKVIDLT